MIAVSDRTWITMLLTLHLEARSGDGPEPFDVREWNRLGHWLQAHSLVLEDLVKGDTPVILEAWVDRRVKIDRLRALLDRGALLEASLGRWLQAGIWVLGQSDPGYPVRLNDRLRASAPPLLFGVGDPRIFANPGVGIVGSRDAAPQDMQFAFELGGVASREGFNVVSGGARGIDERAAAGAIADQGTVIVVLADSLVRNANRIPYRDLLPNGDLLLVTPYSPESGFSPGNAMGRNRIIYCLADTAIAVSSVHGRGGTFGGASIALRHGWVPIWVAQTDDPGSGNPGLVDAGARWLPARDADAIDFEELCVVPVAGDVLEPVAGQPVPL